MTSPVAPVAVIGAGLAGLSAAYHLAQAGRRVVLLEARPRAGGRILTLHTADGASIELGAEFIHGTPKATLDLLREANIERGPLDGEHFAPADGRLVPMQDNTSDLYELIAIASRKRGDRSAASFLEEVGHDPARRDAAKWMCNLLEGFDAADPERASLKSIVSEWGGDASIISEQGRPVGGYGQLVDFMVNRLDPTLVRVRRNTPVQHVRWSKDGAELTVSAEASQAVEASAVIVTVPLSILKLDADDPSAIQFDPPLDMKTGALAGLEMGPVHRVMLRFPSPIWEDRLGGPLRAGTFLHSRDQAFPTFWTHDPGSPWLTAWCGGPRAARLDAEGDNAIIAAAAASARAVLTGRGAAAPEPLEAQFHNWQRDPWSLGAYTYVATGGFGARKALAKPLDGVLYFAGEATDPSGEAATVAGAIMSGTRAAREVLKQARRHS